MIVAIIMILTDWLMVGVEGFLSLAFCHWNGDLFSGNVVYVHLFYCMDCVDDGLFHRCYGQSLADTPAYV